MAKYPEIYDGSQVRKWMKTEKHIRSACAVGEGQRKTKRQFQKYGVGVGTVPSPYFLGTATAPSAATYHLRSDQSETARCCCFVVALRKPFLLRFLSLYRPPVFTHILSSASPTPPHTIIPPSPTIPPPPFWLPRGGYSGGGGHRRMWSVELRRSYILKGRLVFCDSGMKYQQMYTSMTLSTRKKHICVCVCGIMPRDGSEPRPPRGGGFSGPFASQVPAAKIPEN